jgi:hypothetical protein
MFSNAESTDRAKTIDFYDFLDNAVLICRNSVMLLALAAQLSVPTLTRAHVADVRTLFSFNDVPDYLVRQGEVDRTVFARTTVRPDGTTEGCVAERSSGDPRLDAYTCALIVKRAKFLPARWVDGSSAYGVIRVPVRWQVTDAPYGNRPPANTADLDILVNRPPKGARQPVVVDLQVATDEGGHPVSCNGWSPLPDAHAKDFPELVPIACQQATASLVLTPPVDPSGKAYRSVLIVSVLFKVDK